MIANETKTRRAGTSDNVPTRFTPMHWLTTALGIVIAITCLFVLLRDNERGDADKSQSVFVNTSTSPFIEHMITAPGTATSAILRMF